MATSAAGTPVLECPVLRRRRITWLWWQALCPFPQGGEGYQPALANVDERDLAGSHALVQQGPADAGQPHGFLNRNQQGGLAGDWLAEGSSGQGGTPQFVELVRI
jgi:hypothetical protein